MSTLCPRNALLTETCIWWTLRRQTWTVCLAAELRDWAKNYTTQWRLSTSIWTIKSPTTRIRSSSWIASLDLKKWRNINRNRREFTRFTNHYSKSRPNRKRQRLSLSLGMLSLKNRRRPIAPSLPNANSRMRLSSQRYSYSQNSRSWLIWFRTRQIRSKCF